MRSLKSIDLSLQDGNEVRLVNTIREACIEDGFMYVTGHGVDPALIADMRASTVAVFDQPDSMKARHRVTPERYRGYIPAGFFTPNAAEGAADPYEGFKLHAEISIDAPVRQSFPFHGPNDWPPSLPQMRETVLAYWAALDGLTQTLLRLLAKAAGLPSEAFNRHFDWPLTNMTLLHYPERPAGFGPSGIHPHKDASALTILYPDSAGGLFVRARTDEWIEARAPDGAFVVNLGDVLEHWTGGLFRSTPHYVDTPPGKARYSFPYFSTPSHDAIIQPLIEPVKGYQRDPMEMGPWYLGVIRSNWPDAPPVDPNFDPGAIEGTKL